MDPDPREAAHELMNHIGALLLDLQLSAEQERDPEVARRLTAWAELAQAAADRAAQLRDHLGGGPT
ncbi:MAG: hypothetical protein IH960_05440 [Chloroflexi bacterium]|nr:hypothetical protein [Chloroflexota bacterium]